jgi:hypothetical protein
MDMIDQIGGWKSVSSMGNKYGEGYSSRRIGKMIDKFKME